MSSGKEPTYFGRYQVVEELGTGSMGVVYLCVDPRLSRPVAVKVLKLSVHQAPAERTQYEGRFRHEAEAAGRLSHPDIVQIYDIGPSYLVMEYLEGRTLSSLIKQGANLTVKQVCSIAVRVADAIDYAHRNGIVHRDVKPANVMLLDDGGVKVMDFGVARLPSSTLTVAGTVVGSVRYMAPEQMMGEKVDGRADVFSLAAVAYELLTGRAPFSGKTITEVVSQVVKGRHVPPRQVDARLPEALSAVFARGFAVKPEHRYPRAMDFARELRDAAQPVLDLAIVHAGDGTAAEPPTVQPAAGLSTTEQRPAATAMRSSPATTLLMGTTPAAREGVLILDSDPPGARVYLDGNPAGRTPISGLEVAFGRHVVRLEAEGREAVSTEIEVKREHPLKAVTCMLPRPEATQGAVRPGQFVPFGPDVTPPQRVSGGLPSYPDVARERRLEGAPVVEVWVSETGDVIDVAILESAGAVLDEALLEAVATWRFSPATLRGVAVSVRVTVQHLFRS